MTLTCDYCEIASTDLEPDGWWFLIRASDREQFDFCSLRCLNRRGSTIVLDEAIDEILATKEGRMTEDVGVRDLNVEVDEDERICPVCGGTEWYDDWPHPDHRRSYCERCDWPPPVPMSPEEWRTHPDNPVNKESA